MQKTAASSADRPTPVKSTLALDGASSIQISTSTPYATAEAARLSAEVQAGIEEIKAKEKAKAAKAKAKAKAKAEAAPPTEEELTQALIAQYGVKSRATEAIDLATEAVENMGMTGLLKVTSHKVALDILKRAAEQNKLPKAILDERAARLQVGEEIAQLFQKLSKS